MGMQNGSTLMMKNVARPRKVAGRFGEEFPVTKKAINFN